MRRRSAIVKKVFSISLIFNALMTISYGIIVLANFYQQNQKWQPFFPYLINSNLIWVAIAVAVINIFPSVALGRSLQTGRFLFHHYIYGLIVLFCAVIYVILFSPLSIFSLFFMFDTSVVVNIGRFFILAGLCLVLDDLPDVSKHVESALNRLKLKAAQSGRFLSAFHFFCGVVSMYIFAAIAIGIFYNAQWVTLANLIFACTMFITGVTSLIFVRRQVWQKIKP